MKMSKTYSIHQEIIKTLEILVGKLQKEMTNLKPEGYVGRGY
jgi:hypothetical protein